MIGDEKDSVEVFTSVVCSVFMVAFLENAVLMLHMWLFLVRGNAQQTKIDNIPFKVLLN